MKLIYKIIILTLLGVTAALPAHSQLRYGIRLGGDFSDARLKNAPGYELKNGSGFAGGLVLEYNFEKSGLAPDIAVEYARHNTRLASIPGEPHGFGRNFIDVPLRLKYKYWIKQTKFLFAPMVYTGPLFSFRLDHGDALPMATKMFQPSWEVGIGFDAINFLQITAGYRFGMTNAVKNFAGCPDAVLKTNGWNVAATLLFDF